MIDKIKTKTSIEKFNEENAAYWEHDRSEMPFLKIMVDSWEGCCDEPACTNIEAFQESIKRELQEYWGDSAFVTFDAANKRVIAHHENGYTKVIS